MAEYLYFRRDSSLKMEEMDWVSPCRRKQKLPGKSSLELLAEQLGWQRLPNGDTFQPACVL